MSRINGAECPILQKLQGEGRDISFAVVSKKHNKAENKMCPISHIAIKKLNLEAVPCEKLEQYVRENRLVVIARDDAAPVVFLRNGKSCYSDAPEFIRFVDKKSSSDEASIEKELLEVVIEELTDDEYEQFCTFCLSAAAEFSNSAKVDKQTQKEGSSSAEVHSQDFQTMKKDQFVLSILNQLAEIVDRHFDIIRQSREDEAEQRKVAEKAAQRRHEEVRYQETQRRNRKEQEKKNVVKASDVHHQRNHEEKRNNIRQSNDGLPVAEYIS